MIRETVLRNARIVLDDEIIHGSILIRDDTIADVAAGSGETGDDLDGDLVMPGLVELHTDHLEGHAQPRPGTHWDPVPAVLAHDVQLSGAGVTTVFDAIRVGAQEGLDGAPALARSMADAIEYVDGAGIARADHFIHIRCEVAAPTSVAEFEAFLGARSLRLASLMDHTPGQRQYADVEAFRRYMVGRGEVTNAGFEPLVAKLKEAAELHSIPNRRAIARLALDHGLTLAAHDDATTAHVAESSSLGVRISEFPTTEIAAHEAHERGQLVVMGAPNIVRGRSQSGNVSAAQLLGLGLLDILSSDYVPASPLQAIIQLDADGRYPLVGGSKLVSGNPARAVGLDDRGVIAVGRRADLVRVHQHRIRSAGPAGHDHVVPVVRAVYRRGERVT